MYYLTKYTVVVYRAKITKKSIIVQNLIDLTVALLRHEIAVIACVNSALKT